MNDHAQGLGESVNGLLFERGGVGVQRILHHARGDPELSGPDGSGQSLMECAKRKASSLRPSASARSSSAALSA